MSLLVLGGVTLDPYIAINSIQPAAPELVGSVSRSVSGARLEQFSARKRGWTMETIPLEPADVAILRGLFEGDGETLTMAASGDLIEPDASITLEGEIGDGPFLRGRGASGWSSALQRLTLTLWEV